MVFTVGVLSLTAAVWFASKLLAEPPARPAATGQTRVAMLNMRWVIKNYLKYNAFINSMKLEEKKYIDELTLKQKAIEKLAKEMEPLPQGAGRDSKEQEIRNLQREMDDIKLRARKEVQQKGNDEMVKVYKEVRDAAYRHATSNGFDLVLHFDGAADKTEIDSPVLVMRSINSGGCAPLYWNPSLDISGHVLKVLNDAYTAGGSK
jgi:Skp family chaperone for outer membrane proteins